MSLFRPERRTDYPTGSLDELYRRRESPLASGVSVTAETAMQHSAVWACVDLIASLASTLPLCEYRKVGEVRQEIEDPVLFMLPDGELDLTAWLYQMFTSLLVRGNAYGLILTRDREGWPTKIQMLDPTVVQVTQRGAPLGTWEFRIDKTKVKRFDPLSGTGDLWHTPAYVRAGTILGMSPIQYAAMSIGTGLGAQQFGGNWFRDSATPAAVISNEKSSNPTAAKLLKSSWMKVLGGGNREPVVLADGWKYTPIQVSAEESQFLATIRASVADVARFFRVPPSEIGAAIEGDSMTYSNTEQRAIALLTYTLNPWLIRAEKSISGLRPRGRYDKFNIDALLRTDLKTRYEAHELSIVTGWKNADDVRKLEEMLPLPDGEGQKFLWPPRRQQLTEEELGTGDPIEGGVDDSPEGGAANNGSSQGAAPARS